jgi:hypothetical protein
MRFSFQKLIRQQVHRRKFQTAVLNLAMSTNLAEDFRSTLFGEIVAPSRSVVLQTASLTGKLAVWTAAMTSASVGACEALGWSATARKHRLELLPIPRSEYLALDLVAFRKNDRRWIFPTAVMELENNSRDDQIAYSLWKVLCVRAELRVVFCYRKNLDDSPRLIQHLAHEVIEAMGLSGRATLEGKTLVVIGCKNKAETFPYGFFSWWSLQSNTGKFERI